MESIDISKKIISETEYEKKQSVNTKKENNVFEIDSSFNDIKELINFSLSYSIHNTNNIKVISELMSDEYKNTEQGHIDSIVLNYLQHNCILFIKTIQNNPTYEEIIYNPYFKKIQKYMEKQEILIDKNSEKGILWNEIGDESKHVINIMIMYILNRFASVKGIESFMQTAYCNLDETTKLLQQETVEFIRLDNNYCDENNQLIVSVGDIVSIESYKRIKKLLRQDKTYIHNGFTFIDKETFESFVMDDNSMENFGLYNGIIYPISIIKQISDEKKSKK